MSLELSFCRTMCLTAVSNTTNVEVARSEQRLIFRVPNKVVHLSTLIAPSVD